MAKSVGFKINALLISTVAVVALVFLVFLLFRTNSIVKFSDRELEKSAKQQISEIAQNVYHLAATANDLSKKMLMVSLNTSREVIARYGSLSIQGVQRWTAINQFSNESIEIDVPNINFGGTVLPKVTSFDVKVPIVDEITRLTGATSTIFVKMNQNGDMLRVATTVKK
ncbi:MAG: Cache 3/Cache 2 fusion domain-containing protein, partial [Ignavibacteria bacterium]|nr:Cache 3/Cache 2 fusion domain-containing protein [Ignavibacteria bacterium]